MEPSDGCRDWPFYITPLGYGFLDKQLVSRLVCIAWHGSPPFPKAQAAHSCGRRSCWAGEHLRWATAKENTNDRRAQGTWQEGETASGAKLTANDVRVIRLLYRAGGVSQRALAARFGVTHATIGLIVNNKRWRSV